MDKKEPDIDYEAITELMEERIVNYASVETQAKELAAMTGLSLDVASAFFRGLSSKGMQKKSDVRGYAKPTGIYQPRKKKPRK
jgi:hypothetical protein